VRVEDDRQITTSLSMALLGRKAVIALILIVLNISDAFSSTKKSLTSLITGANGFLGREIVHELVRQADLSDKYKIICLVRSGRVEDERKYWNERAGNFVFVEPYDMLDGGKSLEAALCSCGKDDVVVYHIASHFGPSDNHEQTAMENVKGTEDVVLCLAKYPNTRLVLTSSMAAVRGTGQKPQNGVCYTNLDWNTISELGINWGSSYQWSKAQSERRAWELANKFGVPMTSICPSFIFGPSTDGSLDSSNSYSIQLLRQWFRGESPVQSRLCVDVRDVAKAHVAAGARKVSIGKRYVLSTEFRLPSKSLADILKEFSSIPEQVTYDSEFDGGAIKIGHREVLAEELLRNDLDIQLSPTEVTIRDMAKILSSS
jgi:nucleoside-diphosphate-sugar epimerase